MTSRMQVEQDRRSSSIGQWSQCDYQGPGRQDISWYRFHVWPCIVQDELTLHQCIHKPVELAGTHSGQQPANRSANGQQADTVAPSQAFHGDCGCATHRKVKTGSPATCNVGEGVKQEDDFSAPLGMEQIDVQLAAPGSRLPIDVASLVSLRELANIREFKSHP